MIEIKNYKGDVLLRVETETLSDADLRGAVLRDADLRGADLSGADLIGAVLRDANLSGAVLIGEKLKTSPVFISGLTWEIVITNNYMTIGCQRHSHENWTAFDDSTISKMEKRALEFWKKHKVILLALCAEMASK